MQYKCNECETVMSLIEDKHVCESCDHELTINEAEELFDDGKLVGIVTEEEAQLMVEAEKKDDDDDAGKADSEKEDGEDDDDDDDGDDKNESVKDIEIDYTVDVSEDVSALFEGETLSEDFQNKAKTIFEAAVTTKVKEKLDGIKEQYDTVYEAKLEEATTEINENIDKYLDYVVAEWVKENELAIDQGIKSEMNEEFLEGLKGLFEDHYVHIPEERYDVVEGLAERVDDLQSQLDEEINKSVELTSKIVESTKESLIGDASEGLAESQKEKFKGLAESVKYVDEDQFKTELKTLKESYFKTSTSDVNEDSVDVGQASDTDTITDDLVSRTVAMLNRSDY